MTDTELRERLEKLERDNRRLKRLAAAGLLLIAILGVLYAPSCSLFRKGANGQPIPQKITAREFDVVDGSGKVRITIATDCLPAANCWPGIKLFDQNAQALTVLGAGSLTLSDQEKQASLLDDRLQFTAGPQAKPSVTAELGSAAGGGGALLLRGKGQNSVLLNSDFPRLEIQDAKGFTLDLGSIDLTTVRTGETRQTSAASIVMFGRDPKHHLLWQAP